MKGGLRFRRLGGAEIRFDLEAERGGETGRQTIRRQPLPVLQGAGVVVGVVRLEAAQQHLPLQERRTQADPLQGSAGVVVLAGFHLREGRDNAVEVGVERWREGGPAGGFLLQGGVRGVGQNFGRGVRRLGGQFQRLADFAAAGQLLGDLSQPGRGCAVQREGDVKDGDGVAGLPLGAQLASAAEVGLAEHVQMGRRRFGLVDLLD